MNRNGGNERIGVLIVDDEPLSRDVLRALLACEADFRVVGEARDGIEALALCARERPGLIFLDVQMPELNGVEFVKQLALTAADMPTIVFVTAYGEFAVPAFDAAAVDYLVKPFTDDRFRATLARVRGHAARSADETRPATVSLRTLLVTIGDRSIVLATDSIEWVGADGYCSRLHTPAGSYLVRRSLAALERELGPSVFVRVHRGALVRASAVCEIRRGSARGGEVVMRSGAKIPVSERRRSDLVRRLGGKS
ncbi:MAG: LyTR family two component transcriptional regulator [Gemmatimonadetes bacterium]|nr:LyTR family two component transcriptional regulator [Gemmatimonadota bacterium]